MLDHIFACLADPTRRDILARLSREDGLTVADLASPFDMSGPAVIKHLNVLAGAGLLVRERVGRTTRCHLRDAPLRQAQQWMERHLAFWSPRLDRLADHVESEERAARRREGRRK